MWKVAMKLFTNKAEHEQDQPKQTLNADAISDRGMLVFEHTGEVIKAELHLREAGFNVEIKGPPPTLHTGCDMIIVIELMREVAILELLQAKGLPPLQILPVANEMLEPVSIFNIHDFGPWLMVRAANMKITVEKQSMRIVNISGGGCPDVPYLAHKLNGLTLIEAQEPRHIGQTLCCFSLQKAFMEARRLLCG